MAYLVERIRPIAAPGFATPAFRAGLVGGAATAGTGIALVALPVFLLWIVSPYVESGVDGVVHLAACLWLLAHGVTLVHGGTPLGVPPLLLTALLGVLLHRAAARTAGQAVRRPDEPPAEADSDFTGPDFTGQGFTDPDFTDPDFADPAEDRAGASVSRAGAVMLGLCLGYLLVAAVALVSAATVGGSGLGIGPLGLPDVGRLLLLVLSVAAGGVRAGAGEWPWSGGRRGLARWWRSRPWTRLRLRSALLFEEEPARTEATGGAGEAEGFESDRWPLRWLRRGSPSWLLSLDPPARLDRCRRWCGHRLSWLFAWPLGRLYVPGGATAAARAGAGAGAALLGGGAVVFAVSLLLHFGAAGSVAGRLAPDLVGRVSLLLLCATVLPNAAVWAAGYSLGPGFALDGRFSPLVDAASQPPEFPLFAALPGAGRSPLVLLVAVVPLVAGAALGVLVGRAAEEWGVLATACISVLAALCTGVLVLVFAAASGGALGSSALAQVGPSPWWTGAAAFGWALGVGLPGALLARGLPRLRPHRITRRRFTGRRSG